MKSVAIYTRVSSEQQKEGQTIESQVAALREYAQAEGYGVVDEWVFRDEGYRGATLVRPGLERVRDLAAEGQIEAVLVYGPDRLNGGVEYRRDCSVVRKPRGFYAQRAIPLGAQYRLANAAQSGLPRDRLFGQDADRSEAESDPTPATTRRFFKAMQRESGTGPGRLDRDSGAGPGHGRDFRIGPGATAKEQTAFDSSSPGTDSPARNVGGSAMWI